MNYETITINAQNFQWNCEKEPIIQWNCEKEPIIQWNHKSKLII